MKLVMKAICVQRGSKDVDQSYLATLSFGDIARLLHDNHLYVPNDPDLPDLAQRKLNVARVKAIAQYILDTYQDGTTFFPPICVNVQPAPTYQDGYLSLPYHSVSLRLTDGQHRCFGIRQALQDIQYDPLLHPSALAQLEVGVLLYAGLSLEDERQAFRDQNLLVQRPNVSLSHTFDQRSPAVLIAKKLLEQVPQFQDNVELLENNLNNNPKLLTFSTLVSATKLTFPKLKSSQNLESMIEWLSTFWIGVASILPNNPWDVKNKEERSQQKKDLLLVAPIFFQALGLLAHDLYYKENVPSQNLRKWLTPLQLIDWQKNNQLWRERGVTSIGAKGEPIVPNTKTTVNVFHKILQEFVGIVPVSV